MNYYQRHIGDYAKDTGHLSMLEHGAYNLLMDRYYGTERGIPDEDKYRKIRANTEEERAAVDVVLREFFRLDDDGVWRKGRIEEEIKRYQEGEPEREAKKAHDAERQRRSREERAKLFDELRAHGHVPAFNTPMSELRALLSRVTSHETGDGQPRDDTGTHTQTQTQTPNTNTSSPGGEDVTRGKRARKKSGGEVQELWLSLQQMQDGNPDLTTEVAETYLAYRRNKKAPLTKIAWRDIVREVRKVGRPIDGALAYAMNRNWQGFDATWMPGYGGAAGGAPPPGAGGRHARHAAAIAELDKIIAEGLGVSPPPEGEQHAAGDDFIDVPSRRVD